MVNVLRRIFGCFRKILLIISNLTNSTQKAQKIFSLILWIIDIDFISNFFLILYNRRFFDISTFHVQNQITTDLWNSANPPLYREYMIWVQLFFLYSSQMIHILSVLNIALNGIDLKMLQNYIIFKKFYNLIITDLVCTNWCCNTVVKSLHFWVILWIAGNRRLTV